MLKCYYADTSLLDEQVVYEKWFCRLDENRQKKALHLKNTEDKKRSVMAGVLLYLANPAEHRYSISHSGKYASVVVSDRPVGVDVESSQRSVLASGREKQLEAVTKKCFAPEEWTCFSSVDTDEKKRLFLEYWTRKESYSKSIGLGMQLDFSTIDTETDKESYFTTWTEDGYCFSIYVEDGNYDDLEIKKIEQLELERQ